MTDYVKQLYSVKAISTGAALLLASVGMANAAPNDESFGSIEPKPVVAVHCRSQAGTLQKQGCR